MKGCDPIYADAKRSKNTGMLYLGEGQDNIPIVITAGELYSSFVYLLGGLQARVSLYSGHSIAYDVVYCNVFNSMTDCGCGFQEKDDLEAQFREVNEKADLASSQLSALQNELERTRQHANDALKAIDAERQQLRSANNKYSLQKSLCQDFTLTPLVILLCYMQMTMFANLFLGKILQHF